jgi:hypothetical protein
MWETPVQRSTWSKQP